jgi:hypothetical protein
MVSCIHCEAKKLEVVHREKLKIDADFNKRIKNVDTQNKMCAHCSACALSAGGGGNAAFAGRSPPDEASRWPS